MRRSILGLASVALLILSNTGGAADSVQRAIEGYKTWKPTTEKPIAVPTTVGSGCEPRDGVPNDPNGPHAAREILVYVSPNGRATYDKKGLFPEGTVIVKEKHAILRTYTQDKSGNGPPKANVVGQALELGVMIKHGKSWEYSFIDATGKTVVGEQLLHCARCHARATNDSVFGRPAASGASKGGATKGN